MQYGAGFMRAPTPAVRGTSKSKGHQDGTLIHRSEGVEPLASSDVSANPSTIQGNSMRAIFLALGLLLAAVAFAPASAASIVMSDGISSTSPLLTLVQYSAHHHYDKHHREMRRRYIAGHRYHSPPHGWHRYAHRPRDWHTRGCILVGPIWFCP